MTKRTAEEIRAAFEGLPGEDYEPPDDSVLGEVTSARKPRKIERQSSAAPKPDTVRADCEREIRSVEHYDGLCSSFGRWRGMTCVDAWPVSRFAWCASCRGAFPTTHR
jgi:hypothetical protein